jgi:uncharacterized protein (TIGR02285 family)
MHALNRLRAALAHIVLCALCTCTWAQGKPVMTWVMQDFPPVSMPVNGQPTVGVVDTLLKQIAREWPEVEHRYVVTNFARVMPMLEGGKEACATNVMPNPEREFVAYFSETHIGLPLQLIVRDDAAAKLPMNGAGEVLPDKLFGMPGLRGLITRNRSYSASLDLLLKQRAGDSGMRYVNAADGGANILKMMVLNRADYTLEYDFALAYQLRNDPSSFKGGRLRVLPIAGARPVIAAIACPRTPWGREAIRKIDALVARLVKTDEYLKSTERWVTPQTTTRFRAARDAFIRQRATTSNAAKYQ